MRQYRGYGFRDRRCAAPRNDLVGIFQQPSSPQIRDPMRTILRNGNGFSRQAMDGAGASPALGAAAQATINLASRARPLRAAGRADVRIAQDIAGNRRSWMVPTVTDSGQIPGAQNKSTLFVDYLICCAFALNQGRISGRDVGHGYPIGRPPAKGKRRFYTFSILRKPRLCRNFRRYARSAAQAGGRSPAERYRGAGSRPWGGAARHK